MPAQADRLSDHDYQQLLAFRDGLRRFHHWSEDHARSVGLTGSPSPRPIDMQDQGGDPACWAHLFEEAEPIDAVDGVHSRSTISTPPAPIVAAGAPADGRVLDAALMLGADGIALDTRFSAATGATTGTGKIVADVVETETRLISRTSQDLVVTALSEGDPSRHSEAGG